MDVVWLRWNCYSKVCPWSKCTHTCISAHMILTNLMHMHLIQLNESLFSCLLSFSFFHFPSSSSPFHQTLPQPSYCHPFHLNPILISLFPQGRLLGCRGKGEMTLRLPCVYKFYFKNLIVVYFYSSFLEICHTAIYKFKGYKIMIWLTYITIHLHPSSQTNID